MGDAPLRRRLRDVWGAVREAAGGLVGLAFPAGCRLCDRPLEEPSRLPVCARCLASFRRLAPPICGTCGRPMVAGAHFASAGPQCALCRRDVYVFSAARSFAAYDDALVRAVTILKHEGIPPLADWFAKRLADVFHGEPALQQVDVVVPVPMHPDRRRLRGHNQAELLSRALARNLALPHEPRMIERVKPRPAKLKLSRHERWSAARAAYAAASGARIDKRRVLLVDDVFTTGATLDACSRVLGAAGATGVAALTVARVVGAWDASAP